MDNDKWSFEFGYSKLKSARQKKRLQKEDSEKQLRALHRLEHQLSQQKRNLPLIPLEIPYQKGWVRSFRLRDDVARSSKALFFQTLLEKINTKEYSKEKTFKKRKKRRSGRKYQYELKVQLLRSFTEDEWNSPKLLLTEYERQLFTPQEQWNAVYKRVTIQYVFTEPWRYVLQTKPHMITHTKLLDQILEQQIQELNNKIEMQYLRPVMNRLIHGKSYWRWNYAEKEKEKYTLKNKQLRQIVHEANNDII